MLQQQIVSHHTTPACRLPRAPFPPKYSIFVWISCLMHGAAKRYTFTLKDNLLPRNPENGREQSTVSYEYDFTLCDSIRKKNGSTHVFIPWKDLQPTYRGKEAREAPPVDLKSVKRMSIMMRRYEVPSRLFSWFVFSLQGSFFGGQEGTFSLSLRSIAAVQSPQPDLRELEEGSPGMAQKPSGWTTWPLSFAVNRKFLALIRSQPC